MTLAGSLAAGFLLLAPAFAAAGPAGDDGQIAYQARQFEAALALWQPRAAKGDAAAAFGLGLLHDLGQGVRQDRGAAYRWYLRAAAAGNPQAEFNVAVMNDSGRGTLRDGTAAALWYGKAASHGLGRAQYNLAQLYEAGEGVPRNLEAALAWYQAAAPTLPAAASHAARLRAPRGVTVAGDALLLRPSPAEQPVAQAAGGPAELVWAAPPQPVPVRFYVVVLSLDAKPPAPVFSGFTDRTALLVDAASGLHAYAWRVCAVGRTAPHYAMSAWKIVSR